MINDNPMYELLANAAEARGLAYNGRHVPYNPKLIHYARLLRAKMTDCEKRVQSYLESLPHEFYSQRIIDHYIADFYIPEFRLVIEIDGEQHISAEGKEYDSYRDKIMTLYGLYVHRIANQDVRYAFNRVCQEFDAVIERRRNELATD